MGGICQERKLRLREIPLPAGGHLGVCVEVWTPFISVWLLNPGLKVQIEAWMSPCRQPVGNVALFLEKVPLAPRELIGSVCGLAWEEKTPGL